MKYVSLKSAIGLLEIKGYSRESIGELSREELTILLNSKNVNVIVTKEPDVDEVFCMFNNIVSEISAMLVSDLNPSIEVEKTISTLLKKSNKEQAEQMYCNMLNCNNNSQSLLAKKESHDIHHTIKKNEIEIYIELLSAEGIEYEVFFDKNKISVATKNADDSRCERLLEKAKKLCE